MFDIILFSFHMRSLKSEYMKSSKNIFYSPFIQQQKTKKKGFELLFYGNWETVEYFLQQLSLLLAESNGKSFYSPTHLTF